MDAKKGAHKRTQSTDGLGETNYFSPQETGQQPALQDKLAQSSHVPRQEGGGGQQMRSQSFKNHPEAQLLSTKFKSKESLGMANEQKLRVLNGVNLAVGDTEYTYY